MKDTLKSNLTIAEQLHKSAEKIERSQIEEAVRQISRTHSPLTSTDASELFTEYFGKDLISSEFFDFCIRLNEFGACKTPLPEAKLLPEAVSFMDNASTRAALEKFNCEKGCTLYPRSDLRSCCEDSASSANNCCILPISSTEDGIFSSFFKLVKTYELKVRGVCDIIMPDGESEMRFALLSRNTESDASCRHTAFSFLPVDNDFSKLMSVFGSREIGVDLVYCTPCEFSIDKTEYTVCIDCKNTDPLLVMFFLEAALPGHTELGIF